MLNSPFTQAGASKLATRSLLRGSKFSFNGIVTNLEKTVSTINQVVPLYNQVKPLISNSKTIFNAFKSTRNKGNKRSIQPQTNDNPNIINVNIQEQSFSTPIKKEESNTDNIFISIDTPNKPFFN
jgi:hypothetical protein